MSTEIPPEEIGICERCDVEFRRKNLGQRFCCNAHGASKDEHSPDCQRKDTQGFSNKPNRHYTLDADPGEILWWMQSNLEGNPNFITIGAAVLSYKGAQLNYEAAKKTARYTRVLGWLTAALVFVGIVNLIVTFLN